MKLTPLRGRVAVRLDEPKRSGLIHLTDDHYDNERARIHSKGQNAMSSSVGRVLAVGEPAQTKRGVPIDPGFAPGDDVVVIFSHSEKNARVTWEDGEPCHFFPQSNVIGIVEHDHGRSC